MILLSLAACGKALSSGQAQTEEEHKAYVIEDEYPEIADKFKLTLPDEYFRRVGQSMAVASLPKLG